jgi:hypothetical protein
MIMMISGLPILLVFCYFIGSQYRDKKYEAERKVLSAVQSIAFEHMSHVEGIKNLLIGRRRENECGVYMLWGEDSSNCQKVMPAKSTQVLIFRADPSIADESHG